MNKEDYNNPFAAMMLNVLPKDFGEMAKITQEEPERYSLSRFEIERTDLDLIKTIEDLEPNPHSTLKVVEIPDDVQWTIEEYDGVEWVAEVHRIWD